MWKVLLKCTWNDVYFPRFHCAWNYFGCRFTLLLKLVLNIMTEWVSHFDDLILPLVSGLQRFVCLVVFLLACNKKLKEMHPTQMLRNSSVNRQFIAFLSLTIQLFGLIWMKKHFQFDMQLMRKEWTVYDFKMKSILVH